uniref:Calcineurin-like phosphoesterase domain-containing protein n=1 Tax=Hanusia phi TaxID=3032 RepID=A0A7S0I1J4_9CRYP|mmetsp:Transcript_7984/g.18205  ORF Transcript_7984/g.18205 Transcript_7984/m.18205 type:complete len:399 (+) Transcript_7984:129-1325(+)
MRATAFWILIFCAFGITSSFNFNPLPLGVSRRLILSREDFSCQRARRKVASPARTVCSGLHRPHHEGQLKTYYDRPRRIVALGDIHGDVRALATSLRMSDLIDERGNWVGKDSMLVQLGDVLDRGPNDYFCMRLLIKLQKQAREAGGDVICLLGNHEVMNAQLDFRYVDPAAWLGWELEDEGKGKSAQDADPLEIHALPKYMHGRINALRRGHGTLSKTLSTWPVCVVVGDTVFCHGGLMPEAVVYGLQRLNDETSNWLAGEDSMRPWLLDCNPQYSPIWHRAFATANTVDPFTLSAADCTMRLLHVSRMVIGHTPQFEGVNCLVTPEGREIWRVDAGMSTGIFEGPIECLEILAAKDNMDKVNILSEGGIVRKSLRQQRISEKIWSSTSTRLQSLKT